MNKYLFLIALLPLAGCGGSAPDAGESMPASEASSETPPAAAMAEPSAPDFAAILDAQPEEVKARYQYRDPAGTMAFFGVEPGMTVVEALPGGGWYSKLLLPYIGENGVLIGADYPYAMFEANPRTTPERLESKKTWVADWTAQAEGWRMDGYAPVKAFQMAELPADMEGTADAVLFIRALHNLARFDEAFLKQAIADSYNVLKPGGIVGIVQHRAEEDAPYDYTRGHNGYLKQSEVIAMFESEGFELVKTPDDE